MEKKLLLCSLKDKAQEAIFKFLIKSFKFYKGLIGLFLACGGLLNSCVMEDDVIAKAEKADVQIELSASTDFEPTTKAVNENDYKNIGAYKVEIRKSDANGEIVKQDLYSALSTGVTLPRGNYYIKAYKGTEHVASQDEFLAVGSTAFSIVDESTKTISFTCEPTCAKCQVVFDENMNEYFSDYYVTYSTAALGSNTVRYTKTDTAPWYLKVNANEEVKATIHLTRKSDSKTNTGEWKYTLSPNKGWTLKIKANNNISEANMGITITLDEGTNDIPINIEVPSDWIKN